MKSSNGLVPFLLVTWLYWYLWYSETHNHFNDTLGVVFASGIAITLSLFILLNSEYVPIQEKIGAHYAQALKYLFIGFFFMFLGAWVFGEKIRFAEQPVVTTNAIVTNRWQMRVGNYIGVTIYYNYKDRTGHTYEGKDDGSFFDGLDVGTVTAVNYLKSAHNISHLQENNLVQAYIVKELLFLIGGFALAGAALECFRAVRKDPDPPLDPQA